MVARESAHPIIRLPRFKDEVSTTTKGRPEKDRDDGMFGLI